MAYCPQCLIEYAQGSPECVDCRVPLVAGAAPSHARNAKESDRAAEEELVRIRTFTGRGRRIEAQLARKILEAEGIPCALPGERALDLHEPMELVQLLVFKKDAAQATEILQNYLDNPVDAPAEAEADIDE